VAASIHACILHILLDVRASIVKSINKSLQCKYKCRLYRINRRRCTY
jgi:hypothetical protein